MIRARGAGAAFIAALILGACTKHAPYALSADDQRRFPAVTRVAPDSAHDAPLIFGVHDCTLYKAVTEHQDIVAWRVVLRSDWGGSYPKFMTSCTRGEVAYDGGFVHAYLCAQAIGAGGGCAGGGNYRSRDGEHHWEIARQGGHWQPLPP